MRRREFITLLGGAAASWPLTARAQQPATPLVGVMSPLSVATAARNLAALRNRLRELGYTEGRNINIEYRFGDGLAERFPVLVADLVALRPAVIVVGSTAGVLAARKVTRTTPLIWFGSVDDPVALGLVEVLPVRVAMSPGSCCPTMRAWSGRDWSCSGTPCAGSRGLAPSLTPSTPPLTER